MRKISLLFQIPWNVAVMQRMLQLPWRQHWPWQSPAALVLVETPSACSTVESQGRSEESMAGWNSCASECAHYFHHPEWFSEPVPLCPQWSLGLRSDSWLYGRTWLHSWGPTVTFSCLKHYSARSPGMLVWYCSDVWQPEGLTFLKVFKTEKVFSLWS